MTELRYIRLPNPPRDKGAGRMQADLSRKIAAEEVRGSSHDTTVYSARNRFRPAPQAPTSVRAVVDAVDGHEPHSHSWDKFHRNVSAALQRMQQLLRRTSNS